MSGTGESHMTNLAGLIIVLQHFIVGV
jgi:hypothetical protein